MIEGGEKTMSSTYSMRVESEGKQCVVGDVHREGREGVTATRGVGECETLVHRAGNLCGVEESLSTEGGSSLR